MSSNVPTIRFVGGDAAGPSFLYMNGMEQFVDQQTPLLAGPIAGPGREGSAIFDDADAGSRLVGHDDERQPLAFLALPRRRQRLGPRLHRRQRLRVADPPHDAAVVLVRDRHRHVGLL